MGDIGIYKITNKLNGKSYIGQSTQIKKRWYQHKTSGDLLIGRKIKEIGEENFEFEVLETCKIKELAEREMENIKKYNTITPYGYNVSLNTENTYFQMVHYDLETYDKIVRLLKETETTFKDIAEIVGLSRRTISAINLGEKVVYEDLEYPIRNTIKAGLENNCKDCGVKISKQSKRCQECHLKYNDSKPDKETLQKVVEKLKHNKTKIGKFYGVSDNAVKKWCEYYGIKHKKEATPQKEKQSHLNQPKPVYKKDKITGEILKEYESIKSASRELKGDISGATHIVACCKGKVKTAYGYVWEYKNKAHHSRIG